MDLMNKMVKKIARLRDKRICGYVTQRDQIWWYPSAQEVTRNPFSMFCLLYTSDAADEERLV